MGAGPLLPVAVEYCASALGAAHGADALALVTEWNEFRAVPPAKLGRGNAWSRGDGPAQRL
jgi:UDPglucose 6-dehydrogenase